MPITLSAHANCDDVFLIWDNGETPGLDGYALQRKYLSGSKQEQTDFVDNRIDFSKPNQSPLGPVPSDKSPFRRLSWTDHELAPDIHASATDIQVQYRVIPVMHGSLQEAEASGWSPAITMSPKVNKTFSAFFNRGFVISQFMARYLAENKLSLKQFKANLSGQEDKIRAFLGGSLSEEIATLLADAKKDRLTIYCALFELSDPGLLKALCDLGPKASVVLANGAAGGGDENKQARAALKRKKVKVYNRMLKSRCLGHNKFMVICDKKGTPQQVWTGSTNWTPTGLCTQINNGILVSDPGVAKIYMAQWQALKAAKDVFPPALVTNNSKPKPAKIGGTSVTTWFTRTKAGQDMDALRECVDGAQDGILFLMFQPGPTGLQTDIMGRLDSGHPHYNPKLFINGVVSTLPAAAEGHTRVQVGLVSRGKAQPDSAFDMIQPEGVGAEFSHWAAEVTRGQFLSQVGHAIVHSKIVVIDPFGKNPTVITGSHNFSAGAASLKNDENFLIVQGDRELAAACAVHIQAVYDHYRFRAQLGPHGGATPGAGDWQAAQFTPDKLRERQFWTGAA